MRSSIYASEVIANRDRRFGAATVYYPATLIRSDGSRAPLLFTDAELAVAADRASRNAEDIEGISAARDASRAASLRLAGILIGAGALVAAIAVGLLTWRA